MANHYVRPTGYGNQNGIDWNNAFNGFSGINWNSISCGDTIWVAGGTYTDWLEPMKACTSGAQLYIRRARSDASACTSASGWSSEYDSTIVQNGVIAFNSGTNNYITISGRTTASGGDYGWKIVSPTAPGGIDGAGSVYGVMVWNGAICNNNTLEYLEVQGPKRAFWQSAMWGSRGISITSWNGLSSNWTLSHLKIHGYCTAIFEVAADGYLNEYMDIYDIGSNGGDDHPNLMYIKDTDYGIIKYSKFYDSRASGTGIAFSDGGHFNNWQIYGNLFYDNTENTPAAIAVQRATIIGLKIFNNVFSNNWLNFYLSNSVCGSGCESRNNIVHGNGGNVTCGTTSNNLVTNNDNIFINISSKDFHIVPTISNGYPRNTGTNLSSYFTKDMDGNTFGSDGNWDIGAYEYITEECPTPIVSFNLNT